MSHMMSVSTETEGVTTLGPCPACDSWQVDYPDALFDTLSINEVHDVIETALREHYDECIHLRILFPNL